MHSYVSHQLQRCAEDASRYILFVNWQTLEVHTVGFVNLKNTICGEAYYMNFTTLFWECCITNLSTRTPTDIFLIQV